MKMRLRQIAPILLLMATLCSPALVMAGDEEVEGSPHQPWTDISLEQPAKHSHSLTHKLLLWIPNRFLDLIDLFKFDIGVGPAAGAVVRVTPWGQAGYRQMLPLSLRVGNFGRDWPVAIEHSSEIGVGPLFLQSSSREVCSGEVGAGADLLIVGAYGGICVDEVADFVLGLFLIDFKDDDL